MDMITVLLMALGLAMDAFAVAVASGIVIDNVQWKHALKFGFFFGAFQFAMPILGWLLGCSFADYITSVDHWIAFVLLAIIGGKMILETFSQKEDEIKSESELLSAKNMAVLAIATSIDAMAVGVISSTVSDTHIMTAALIIGLVAFVLSTLGVFLGKKLGNAFGKKIEIFGGCILILIGVKILIEHLFF